MRGSEGHSAKGGMWQLEQAGVGTCGRETVGQPGQPYTSHPTTPRPGYGKPPETQQLRRSNVKLGPESLASTKGMMVAGGRSLLLCSLLLSLLVEGRFTRLPVCEGLVGRPRFGYIAFAPMVKGGRVAA